MRIQLLISIMLMAGFLEIHDLHNYLLKILVLEMDFRIILGGGLTIPSKNTLIKSPFIKINNTHEPHRHFSMSKGMSLISEIQIYYKRSTNPVFIGVVFLPANCENEYYYLLKLLLNQFFGNLQEI